MSDYLLGIDAGTESFRAGVFDPAGKCLGFGVSANRTVHPHPGLAEQSPRDWDAALVESIRKALAERRAARRWEYRRRKWWNTMRATSSRPHMNFLKKGEKLRKFSPLCNTCRMKMPRVRPRAVPKPPAGSVPPRMAMSTEISRYSEP